MKSNSNHHFLWEIHHFFMDLNGEFTLPHCSECKSTFRYFMEIHHFLMRKSFVNGHYPCSAKVPEGNQTNKLDHVIPSPLFTGFGAHFQIIINQQHPASVLSEHQVMSRFKGASIVCPLTYILMFLKMCVWKSLKLYVYQRKCWLRVGCGAQILVNTANKQKTPPWFGLINLSRTK